MAEAHICLDAWGYTGKLIHYQHSITSRRNNEVIIERIQGTAYSATGRKEMLSCMFLNKMLRQRALNVFITDRLSHNKHLMVHDESDRICVVSSTPAKRKRTSFRWTYCDGKPYLHPKGCFYKYHTKKQLIFIIVHFTSGHNLVIYYIFWVWYKNSSTMKKNHFDVWYVPLYASDWIYPKFKVKFQPAVPFSLPFLSNLFGKQFLRLPFWNLPFWILNKTFFCQGENFVNLSSFLRWAHFLNMV